MHTYGSALALVGVVVPDHLSAQTEVPVLTGPQAQGDLLVVPEDVPDAGDWEPVTAAGIQVVHGEATGNTHWLHAGFDSPGVAWLRRDARGSRSEHGRSHADEELVVGYLQVPQGQNALLIHTDEHGANGIGAGRYAIRRKRQLVPELQQPVVVTD